MEISSESEVVKHHYLCAALKDFREKISCGNFPESTKYRLEFINNLKNYIPEEKVHQIKQMLIKYEEFIHSPASAKYHGAYDGGLFDHSIAVYECAINLASAFNMDYEYIDPIACIFHDLCKVGSYGYNTSDHKYFYKDNLGLPHGSESLRRILKSGIPISNENWEFAVAYHMGAFNANNEDTINFGKMCEKYPEVLLLHTADMMASKLYKL